MSKQNYIAVYGSLRKGQYNFEHFKSGLEHIETLSIPNYNLYDLGAYPAVTKGDNELVVDVMEVKDEMMGKRIRAMELGAGYQVENIAIGDKVCELYTFENKPRNADLVENGDWSKYLESKQ